MAELDYLSHRLLRELSRNSRQSFSSLGRKLGVSGRTVARRLTKLEKEYGLRYVLEMDREALGLTANYIMLAKLKKVPPRKELGRVFGRYPEAQYAALTKGDFDLFVYATSSSHENLSRWANWVRQELDECLEYWGATNIIGNWFGFFPLRGELIGDLQIEEPKKTLLKMLNQNARTPLKRLAKALGLSMSTAQYHLRQLMEAKYVKRFTIVISRPPKSVQYVMTWKYGFLSDYLKHAVRARKVLVGAEKEGEVNSLILATNSIGATDDLVVKAFDTIKEAQEFDERMLDAFGPVVVEHKAAFIVEDVFGSLPARNLDVKKEYYGKWKIYDYLEK